MKRLRSMVICVAVLLGAGCSRESSAPQIALSDLSGTAWRLASLEDEDGVLKTPVDAEVTLVFGDQGGVTGAGGCNRYFGSIEAADQGRFTIGPLGSTRMACEESVMALEDRFLRALEACEWAAGTPERLELEAAQSSTRLVFMPAEPAAQEPS